jgi:hypothetical protein
VLNVEGSPVIQETLGGGGGHCSSYVGLTLCSVSEVKS